MRWLVAVAMSTTAAVAAERSPPLTLGQARAVVSMAGVNVGTVFPVGDGRYLIRRITSKEVRPNVFSVEIEVEPLARFNPAGQ